MTEKLNCKIRIINNNSLGKGLEIQVYPYPAIHYYGYTRAEALANYRRTNNLVRKRFNYV